MLHVDAVGRADREIARNILQNKDWMAATFYQRIRDDFLEVSP